jgi:alpha-2-macroglobulin-like protein
MRNLRTAPFRTLTGHVALGLLVTTVVLAGCADEEARLASGNAGAAGASAQAGQGGTGAAGAGAAGAGNGGAGASGAGNGGGGAAGAGNGGAGAAGAGNGGAGAAGAGNGGAGASGAGNGGAPVAPVGAPDVGSNGSISIDEATLRGEVGAGQVTLHVTVASSGQAAAGKLPVSIRSVDGKSTYAVGELTYSVDAGGKQTIDTVLSLPPGIADQADWVSFNVRVEDGAPGGLRVTRSLQSVLRPYEVLLEGASKLKTGKKGSYRIRVRDPQTRQPVAGAAVTVLVKKDDATVTSFDAVTDGLGSAVIELSLGDPGAHQIFATASVQKTSTQASAALSATAPGSKVLLTTDKPIYQPGQTIHLRALSLSEQGNTPVAAAPALFEIEDGKGNKIFKRAGTTDSHGIAAADFVIGSVVNLGGFKARAQVGEGKTEKTVNVSRYALPKFKVGVQTDKPWYKAAETVLVTLDAGYFFGKPVSMGDVTVEASTLDVGQTVFQTVQGKTDGAGKFSLSLQLPASLAGLPLDGGKALVNLKVTVVDAAKQEVTQEKLLTVSQTGMDLALVPESTTLVPGVENHLDLFASDPLGAPVPAAAVALTVPGGEVLAGTTDGYGHVGFAWTPLGAPGQSFHAAVQSSAAKAEADFVFGAQVGEAHVVVRTDRAVYAVGESVVVTVGCSDPSSTVYVDWINAGQTVDMRTLQATDGAASFTMPLDPSLLGSNRVEAYIVDGSGNVVRAGRTVFARGNTTLSVGLATDQPQYEPGQPAKLTFTVKDEAGTPQVAALGVQVVDEAVFALVEAKPGLLRTYFELEEGFSQPAYEIHGPGASFDDLLFSGTSDADPAKAQAAQTKAAASFAALGDKTPTGLSATTWPDTLQQGKAKLVPFVIAEHAALLPSMKSVATQAQAELEAMGCAPTSGWCGALNTTYEGALHSTVKQATLGWDFWGNPYQLAASIPYAMVLVSGGPDEAPGTADDVSVMFDYAQLDVVVPWSGAGGGAGAAGGGAWAGSGGAGGTGTGGASNGSDDGPKVRKDFPETLYVNPSIITGPDGTATVTIPMADSITSWRVSTLANSAGGKLGGGLGSIKVFQEFFADIAFPATLTRGDEVTFPVAVYNYLDVAQTVQLEMQPGDWFTPLGPTQLSVSLAPGEVKGVQVPVRVDKVGVNTLTVKAIGSQKSDAVARMVRVVPDGKEFAESKSGSLGAGAWSGEVSFPAGAVPGSPHLHLDVFPAYLSQVVSGMDSMLQAPFGCFEQTTSTVWPNVLVTRYMKQTGQITPAIELKASSLISAGYQRLLTFEHPGGGFSWFGTQDPNPFLSVTAFGIMEFADMAKVHDVDPAMMDRTVQWMLGQQQADGSWLGDQSEFFSFQTSTVRNTAFVAWALASAGVAGPNVQSALAYVKAHLGSNEDSYTLGIVANALVAGAPADPFTAQLLQQIDDAKQVDGDKVYWSAGGTQTDFYGQGQDADVTSTALATHALLEAGGHAATVNAALAYLVSSRDAGGNFGSTQATIWTLRALLLAASKGTEGAVGTLDVKVDGSAFTSMQLTADQGDVMHTVDLSSLATTGPHQVELSFVGSGKVSYNLVSKHNLPWADAGEEPPGPLSIGLSYDKTSLVVNDTVKATVTVKNNTAAKQNMVMVTLGIPPGFAVQTDDLDAYKLAGVLSNYEATGKQLDLYISQIAASGQQSFTYRLVATMPVKADDGGAKAYPYYQPDQKSSAASTSFDVAAN